MKRIQNGSLRHRSNGQLKVSQVVDSSSSRQHRRGGGEFIGEPEGKSIITRNPIFIIITTVTQLNRGDTKKKYIFLYANSNTNKITALMRGGRGKKKAS
jgi:hypothetical protein